MHPPFWLPARLHLPPTYLHGERPPTSAAVVFAARLAICGRSLRPEPDGESAGCVCLQCLVLQAFVCLPPFACHAHCPHHFAPIQFILLLFACHLFIPCAPGSPLVRAGGLFSVRASSLPATDCPVGSCNTGLQWRPVRRVHLTYLFLFPCRVHDPGPWG